MASRKPSRRPCRTCPQNNVVLDLVNLRQFIWVSHGDSHQSPNPPGGRSHGAVGSGVARTDDCESAAVAADGSGAEHGKAIRVHVHKLKGNIPFAGRWKDDSCGTIF